LFFLYKIIHKYIVFSWYII